MTHKQRIKNTDTLIADAEKVMKSSVSFLSTLVIKDAISGLRTYRDLLVKEQEFVEKGTENENTKES